MVAKPVIDIGIVIDPGALPAVIDRLAVMGYVHRGDLGIMGREVFGLSETDLKCSMPLHHLYVCGRENKALQEHLAFRDFMRQHPEWCQKLSDLKR